MQSIIKYRLKRIREIKRVHLNAIRIEKNYKGSELLAQHHKALLVKISKEKTEILNRMINVKERAQC